MKRILAITLCSILVLSACTLVVSAVSGSWGTTAEDFAPVGELEINWDPDAAGHITLDGDLSEWIENGYSRYTISPRNMVSWFGTVDPNWKLECFFVADSERLYIGFYITDDKACVGDNPAAYNGDAFQIALDWGRNIGDALESDEFAISNPQDIFYSFAMMQDMKFQRQNSDRDGLVYDGSDVVPDEEYEEDWPEFAKDNEWVGMAGATAKTETGWCAEFSVTWQRLASDAYFKLWYADFFRVAKIGPDRDLKIGCSFYYLNRDEDCGDVTWAAGTMKGDVDDGDPQVTWMTNDDGVTLVLKYQEGMEFAATSGIKVPLVDETETVCETETEPGTWLESESETETEHGMTSISGAESITFRGWASLGDERIAAYGYVFDDDWDNAVWSADFIREAEAAIKEKAGSDYATRYEITVDMPSVSTAKVRILRLLVRAEDGSLYELANWDVLALKFSDHVVDEDGYGYVPISPVDDNKIIISPAETDYATVVVTPGDRDDSDRGNDDDEYDEDIFQFNFEGCSSVIGAGSLALVLSAMAAAVALKKKH